jgi:hypothetical protein
MAGIRRARSVLDTRHECGDPDHETRVLMSVRVAINGLERAPERLCRARADPDRVADRGARHRILDDTQDPIVSTDIIGSSYSSIFDGGLTSVIDRLNGSQ